MTDKEALDWLEAKLTEGLDIEISHARDSVSIFVFSLGGPELGRGKTLREAIMSALPRTNSLSTT